MKLFRPRTSRRRVVPVVALMLLAAACGGVSGGELAADPSLTTPDQSTPESVGGAAASQASSTEGQGPKTLADYLGRVGGAGQGFGAGAGAGLDGDDEQTAQQQLIQLEIQACMQAQGFVYVPEEVGDGLRVFLASQNQGVSPTDYAATEGFGISTRFDAIFEGEFDFDDANNPNDEHVATLSEGEAEAWEFALQGEPPQRNDQGQLIDPATGEVVQRIRPGQATGGCRLAAQIAVRGQVVELGALEDDLAVLADRIDSDPRITEIQRAWADCMGSEGFDYADEAEARADMTSQVRPLLRSFFAGTDAGQGADQGGGQGGGNLAQAVSGLQLSAEQDTELKSLQDLERSIAVASLECQGDTGPELVEIRARYEAEFIETNLAALEALSQ